MILLLIAHLLVLTPLPKPNVNRSTKKINLYGYSEGKLEKLFILVRG